MHLGIRNPFVKKIALTLSGSPLLRILNKASHDCTGAQNRVLKSILEDSRNTAFGKEHRFAALKSAEDFRSAVPIRDFEGHRCYIDRMCKGEENVLFPGKALFYNTTSGTTDKPKLIPVSRDYFEKAYNNISKIWFYSCLKDNPRLFHGQNLSAVAPAIEGYVEDGTPFGSISGVVYRNIPAILKDLYATPYPVICINDYQKKYYAMMRFGLGTSISYIITVNPSTLLQFHRTVTDNISDLIKDIHDGTIREDVLAEIDPSERDQVLSHLKPDRNKARYLQDLYKVYGEQLKPKHYWPDLVCINTWKQGNCKLILPKLNDLFSESTVLREFGYQASEARAGLALGNEWDYSILMAHIYYFEFIEEENINQPQPDILGVKDLEIGKSYYILITNGSGLFRYNINDIVRVTGFYNQFPLFEFVQKGEGITSLTGEKLSEMHIMKAVDAASRARNIKVEFYTMFCDTRNYLYKLYIEFGKNTAAVQKNAFINMIDEHLKYVNPEYSAKRGSNRLRSPVLVELIPNSYEIIKARLLNEGKVREGQYKISCLRCDPHMQQIYESIAVGG